MLKYPVFIAARHEDGRLEQFNLKVTADSPGDAIDEALRRYQPRYAGDAGWSLAAVADESRATEPDEEAGKSM